MDSTGFPALSSRPTSMSDPGCIPDRPEMELDRPKAVLPSQPVGMVLRSHSRAGRSEVISAEIHPEKPGGAPRPEPEIARPEVEIAPVAGSSSDRSISATTGSPAIDSSGETVVAGSEVKGVASMRQDEAILSRLVFVGDKFLHICSTIRLTSILINIQIAIENTINFDVIFVIFHPFAQKGQKPPVNGFLPNLV